MDHEFFDRLIVDVDVAGDLQRSGIDAVVVNMEYPGDRPEASPASHSDGWSFTPSSGDTKLFQAFLDQDRNRTYRYQTEVHFGPDSGYKGADPVLRSDWIVTGDNQKTINPLDHVTVFELSPGVGRMDPESVEQVQVDLRYEDPANDLLVEDSFVLTPKGSDDPATTGQDQQVWKLRLAPDGPRTYQHRATYFLAGNVRVESDWKSSVFEPPRDNLLVNEPFLGRLEVDVLADALPVDAVRVLMVLTYTEPDTGYSRQERKTWNAGEREPWNVEMPTLAINPARYEYELTIIQPGGLVTRIGPTSSTATVLAPALVPA